MFQLYSRITNDDELQNELCLNTSEATGIALEQRGSGSSIRSQDLRLEI
jgi:hypothetical protein